MFSAFEQLLHMDKPAGEVPDIGFEPLFASLQPSCPPWASSTALTESTDTAISTAPHQNQNPRQPVTHLSPALAQAPFGPTVSQGLRSQPPRPPNPWILYRADKYNAIRNGKTVPNLEMALAQTMLSVPASKYNNRGRGTRLWHCLPQALLSKVIGLLWSWELPEVRQIYRHLSDLRKLEVRNH
jgi:hypothetical protein